MLALTLVPAGPAAALTQVGAADCGTTFTTPDVYLVVADLTCPSDGLLFFPGASGSILLLNGHTLTGPNTVFSRGIYVAATDVQILGPGTVEKFGTGIKLDSASGVQVVDVTVTQSRTTVGDRAGIFLNRSNGNQIASCTSNLNASAGIFLVNSHSNQVANCSFSSNGGEGVFLFNSSDNQLAANRVSNNGRGGIRVSNSRNNVIQTNTANNNLGHGIIVFGSKTLIQGNTTSSNLLPGIELLSGSTDNTVQGNTALGNGFFDLSDGNLSPPCDNNTWQGNTFGTANQSCIN